MHGWELGVAEPEKPTKLQEIVHELMVRDVMTTDLITVRPQEQVRELRDLLRVYRISGLPVVDEGAMVGIISLEDFIECLADRQNGCVIEEKMTREVETLYADDPLVAALGKFDSTGLGRYPVIERDSGKLVGIVTKGDVIEGLLDPRVGSAAPGPRWLATAGTGGGRLVGAEVPPVWACPGRPIRPASLLSITVRHWLWAIRALSSPLV